jgi:hypothetical protein
MPTKRKRDTGHERAKRALLSSHLVTFFFPPRFKVNVSVLLHPAPREFKEQDEATPHLWL